MPKKTKHTMWIAVLLTSLTVSSVSMAGAVPPDPTNAALLYYQALLTMPKPEGEAADHLVEVAKGEMEPDQMRTFLGKCDNTSEFVEAAADLAKCDWGYRFSLGLDLQLPQLAQLRRLAFILAADARLHAFDGEYRRALERCLLMDSLARHIGDDTLVSYLVSFAVRQVSLKCVQDIVGQAADDAQLLRWLKSELTTAAPLTITPVKPLRIEVEIMSDLMRMDKRDKMMEIMGVSVDKDAPKGAEAVVDEANKKTEELIDALDPKILKQARTIYRQRITATLTALNTPMPYAEKYARLKKLSDDFDRDDPAEAIASAFTANMAKIYTIRVRSDAHSNAILTGIEICLQRDQSGKLPTTLPAGLPKDPFSDRDFQYKRTDTGFTLRCQAKDLDKDIIHEYAFILK